MGKGEHLMIFEVTDMSIGMMIGFAIGIFGVKGIDYITDCLYYRGRPVRKNKGEKKDED